jgi:hypothetical protein
MIPAPGAHVIYIDRLGTTLRRLRGSHGALAEAPAAGGGE